MKALEKGLAKRHYASIERMKTQYLETVQAMKNDVAASRKRLVERFRQEWERRKVELENEWALR
jgi:hypothetical protein